MNIIWGPYIVCFGRTIRRRVSLQHLGDEHHLGHQHHLGQGGTGRGTLMVKIAQTQLEPIALGPQTATSAAPVSDWRAGPPLLAGNLVTLRELQVGDAPALCAALTT